ncbi:hypothetical protein GQ600_25385 [Phytophthora cactorum]|nr:hypothetical protein GQ600_25385 [Phytophthora cactorum]
MELSAWRDAVSYGAYLQPIHLELVETNTTPSSTSAVQELPSQASQNSRNPSDKSTDASSNGTPVTQQAWRPMQSSKPLKMLLNQQLRRRASQ